jgi:tripartite-type tricarboxylate transporter receptor subunit TctC
MEAVMMKRLLIVLVVALLFSIAPQLCAQNYPNQAITLVIPLAPGDAGDVAGRTMAEEMSKLLKVPVVVQNKPGGGLTIGTDLVAKAKKDGYTIVLTANTPLIAGRIINPETVPYDSFKDLTPLGMATRTPVVLTVRSDAPYKRFPDLVEFSKKNPGKIRVGTAGVGTAGHFALSLINSVTGAGMTMVPFKGASPAATALLGGHVEAALVGIGTISGHMQSGQVQGLVVSSKSPPFPDVPVLTELGYRQNIYGVWYGFFAPAGVPQEVIAALVPAIEKAVKEPRYVAKLAALGMVQDYVPPDKLVMEMREEYKSVEEIAKKAGLVK